MKMRKIIEMAKTALKRMNFPNRKSFRRAPVRWLEKELVSATRSSELSGTLIFMAVDLTWKERLERIGTVMNSTAAPILGCRSFRLTAYFAFFLTAPGESSPFLGKG